MAIVLISLALTIFSAAGSVLMLLTDYKSDTLLSAFAYFVFAAAGASLSYSVYILIVYSKDFKKKSLAFIGSNRLISALMDDYGLRTVITAAVSLFFGIAYAVFNGALGIIYSSLWYGALSAYYFMLSLSRGVLLIPEKKKAKRRFTAALKYRNCGIFLFILNIALSSAIAQMIFDDRAFSYPGWIIYAYAAYSFTKLTMSIINTVISRRKQDLMLIGIRDIGLVDSAVSVLALQTALLQAFASDRSFISSFNTLTGIFVSLFSISFSIYIIIKGQKILKHKSDGNNGKEKI